MLTIEQRLRLMAEVINEEYKLVNISSKNWLCELKEKEEQERKLRHEAFINQYRRPLLSPITFEA